MNARYFSILLFWIYCALLLLAFAIPLACFLVIALLPIHFFVMGSYPGELLFMPAEDQKVSYVLLFFFPAAILVIKGFVSWDLYSYAFPMTASIILAIPLVVLARCLDPEAFEYWAEYGFLGFMLTGYLLGSAMFVNAILDKEPARRLHVPITYKHIQDLHKSRQSYQLYWLPPDRTEFEFTKVSRTVYERTNINDTIEVWDHPGFLSMSWFTTGKIQSAAQRAYEAKNPPSAD